MKSLSAIVRQHAEDAAFLSILRERVANAKRLGLAALSDFDARIDAHLDGLRAAGEDGWRSCAAALADWGEAGEVFTAAVLAFESADADQSALALEAAEKIPDGERALRRALEWIEPARSEAVAESLLSSANEAARAAALLYCAGTRTVARSWLEPELRAPSARVRRAALAAAARQGALELAAAAAASLDDGEPEVRAEAARTATLLGDGRAREALWALGRSDFPVAEAALDLALRALPPDEARARVDALAADPACARQAFAACAAAGDPAYFGWLVQQMENPELARAAAASFAALSGADLVAEKLTVAAEPALDDDEPPGEEADLPVPDPERVRDWLRKRAMSFRPGMPLLAGRPKRPPELAQLLREGAQPMRAAAALELVLRAPGTPLFDWRAPAFRQREALEALPWR